MPPEGHAQPSPHPCGGAMLAQQTALQDTIQERTSRALQGFNAARHEFQDALAVAQTRAEPGFERANLARQSRLGDAWVDRADAAVDNQAKANGRDRVELAAF